MKTITQTILKKQWHTNNLYERPLYKQFYDFLQSLIKSISTKQKDKINVCIPQLLLKKILFSSQRIRMSENSINFDDKKILKKRLLQQQQKKFYINDIDVNKILVAKKRKIW